MRVYVYLCAGLSLFPSLTRSYSLSLSLALSASLFTHVYVMCGVRCTVCVCVCLYTLYYAMVRHLRIASRLQCAIWPRIMHFICRTQPLSRTHMQLSVLLFSLVIFSFAPSSNAFGCTLSTAVAFNFRLYSFQFIYIY